MKKNITAWNSITGLASQVVITLFAFIIRSVLIKHLGIAVLGLNSTFASVLNALSLAELGFQTAVVYSLYKPLHDEDYETINDIVNIFKIVYRYVGIFFVCASFFVLPFLRYILSDISVNKMIYIYFLLQASASAASYFIAYKRTLLYADQKDYVAKTIDIITFSVFSLLEILVIVLFESYALYLVLRFIQVVVANAIIQIECNKRYLYLQRAKKNKIVLRKVLSDVKDVFVNRIAGYIYTSTDSIVISAFISTIKVGFYANYMTIASSLRLISNALLHPIVPSIGNEFVSCNDGKERERIFYQFSHLRYVVAIIFVLPTAILIDDFIVIWVGKNFLLSNLFSMLISIDLYIHIVHSSTYDFINALGLFRKDKYIEIMGAVTNIVLSIVLAQIIGIDGVLIGTVIGQIVFWIGRSILVYFDGFKLGIRDYLMYWVRNVFYFAVFAFLYFFCRCLVQFIHCDIFVIDFVISGIVIEIVSLVIVSLIFFKMKEQEILVSKLLTKFRR